MGTLDVNDPGNPRNRDRTLESQRQLRNLLLEWDPIGIANAPEAADEYDCMISPLMHQLHDGEKRREIQNWIVNQVEEHFGMRSDSGRESQLATDLIKWWNVRSLEP